MAQNLLVHEPLEAGPPLLDKVLVVDPLVTSERELSLQSLTRERGNYNLDINRGNLREGPALTEMCVLV